MANKKQPKNPKVIRDYWAKTQRKYREQKKLKEA